ncbi:MAG: B12-binding domain-containing radical SAM protein [Flavobacteriales bacterium]|nr:B12-binding domain-containing radical SAM protein [Flavobacteriales bacterium]
MTRSPHGVILFNPRSAEHKHRIPNSILQVAASIQNDRSFALVDGNRERDPWSTIRDHLASGRYRYFGTTVMPGPQLRQAVPFAHRAKQEFPEVTTIWGGYFAANQHRTVLSSGVVDFVIDGPGDEAFPALLACLDRGKDPVDVPNLIWTNAEAIIRNRKAALPDMDELAALPYAALDEVYPLHQYLGRTFMGERTLAYHSSFGCPFTCSFCAVVPIYKARWKGVSAERIAKDVKYVKDHWGADAIEFHDNNFFVSEKRSVAFSELIMDEGMGWWGEGRIDTLDRYSDDSLRIMRNAGCRMIFFGAESGDDEELARMDKGGTQSGEQILRFAARMAEFDIIPEYSFVLGFPASSEKEVLDRIDRDISFIRRVKEVNPATEIIIYVYSPVPTEGSELFDRVKQAGFHFPDKLTDWLDPVWENFDLRKNPLTPWLTHRAIDRIRDFETVLNGMYPTVSDIKLDQRKRRMLQQISRFRYRRGAYSRPYEIKLLQKLWRYRRPETEGFEML